MKKYEDLKITIRFYHNWDVITSSSDDFGGWDDDWFA